MILNIQYTRVNEKVITINKGVLIRALYMYILVYIYTHIYMRLELQLCDFGADVQSWALRGQPAVQMASWLARSQ